jgi:hypothetical protein
MRRVEDNKFISRPVRHLSTAARFNNLEAGFITHGKYVQAEP